MKILLLGKSGMLGSCFLKHLTSFHGQVFALGHEDLDITDAQKVMEVVKQVSPVIVINCTAYTAVDNAESDVESALKINGYALEGLARACKEAGSKLIHFSTDYVFDGNKSEGYLENDLTDPINVYGKSKLLGEEMIMANMSDFYVVRTSWLFGENGKNFVDTMVSLAKTNKELKVVGDQIGSPTYTNDLVMAVVENFVEKEAAPGIYHLTNSGKTSWYGLAKKIFEILKLDIAVLEVSSAEFPRPAKRPNFSVLINSKLPLMRSWEEALSGYLGLRY